MDSLDTKVWVKKIETFYSVAEIRLNIKNVHFSFSANDHWKLYLEGKKRGDFKILKTCFQNCELESIWSNFLTHQTLKSSTWQTFPGDKDSCNEDTHNVTKGQHEKGRRWLLEIVSEPFMQTCTPTAKWQVNFVTSNVIHW